MSFMKAGRGGAGNFWSSSDIKEVQNDIAKVSTTIHRFIDRVRFLRFAATGQIEIYLDMY
jgi:hypothetical protein